MEAFLLNPNIAYLALVLGLLLALMALLTPGTGIFEIGALFALLLAGWGVYNLPINFWALVVLVVSIVPFLLALRQKGRYLYLGLSILALVIGSAFLFRGEAWWTPAVHPLLALVASALTGWFVWFATVKVLEARGEHLAHDPQALLGSLGEAKTAIHEEGSVQVAGELWSARSEHSIPNGAQVRVVGREGLILLVESVKHQSS